MKADRTLSAQPVLSTALPISRYSIINWSILRTATTSPPSPLDSRIPRPSPSALRRAASLRLRGERLPPHHPRAATTASTALVGHQHHPRRHNHLLQSSQQHQHQSDHRLFPVITENGTDSPRQRSFVSRSPPLSLEKLSLSGGNRRRRYALLATRASYFRVKGIDCVARPFEQGGTLAANYDPFNTARRSEN